MVMMIYIIHIQDQYGEEISDWYWINEEGETVAYTDLQFRQTVFTDLMNRYNERNMGRYRCFWCYISCGRF